MKLKSLLRWFKRKTATAVCQWLIRQSLAGIFDAATHGQLQIESLHGRFRYLFCFAIPNDWSVKDDIVIKYLGFVNSSLPIKQKIHFHNFEEFDNKIWYFYLVIAHGCGTMVDIDVIKILMGAGLNEQLKLITDFKLHSLYESIPEN